MKRAANSARIPTALRALVVAALVALVSGSAAAAPKRVGILVLGDHLKVATVEQTEKWLREHNQQVVNPPLPLEAVKTLENCFVIDDPKCSRTIIDARAITDSVITIRLDVAGKKERDIRLTVDWFVKGHAPITARRTCEDCSEGVLRTTIDAMLLDLAKQSPGFMGRIKAVSDPAGVTVLLDNQTIGVTPIERDVAVGPHKARLVKDGRMGDEKSVTVEAGATVELKLLQPPAAPKEEVAPMPTGPTEKPSRALPITLIATGALAIGAATVMYIKGGPTGDMQRYKDFRTPGYFVGAGGGVLVIVGVTWILATRQSSGPTVGMAPGGGATIGWAGRF